MAGVAEADGVDPDFEFDAPRYYDFEATEPESPTQADNWFDTQGPTGMASPLVPEEGAEGASSASIASGRGPDTEVMTTLPCATTEVLPAAEEVAEEASEAQPETGQGTDKAEAVVGDDSKAAMQESAGPPVALPRPVKAPSNLVTSWGGAPAKRVIAGTQTAAGFPVCALDQAGGILEAVPKSDALVKRTGFVIPRAPRVLAAAPSKSPGSRFSSKKSAHVQTTDAMRAVKVAASLKEKGEANQTSKQRQQNALSHGMALRPRSGVPTHVSTKALTEPKAPNLRTSKRHKPSEVEVPKVAFAQGRVSPKKKIKTRSQQQSHSNLTEPKPPVLATSRRTRPTHWKSRKQLEEEEMAAMPKFHARPLNESILRGEGPLGIPHIEPRPLTTSQPFNLATEKRATPQPGGAPSEPSTNFRALPLDPRILQGPTFQPQRPQHEPIIPRAPAFATEARAAIKRPGEQPFVFSATSSAENNRVETRSMSQRQGLSSPKPFSLVTELRGKAAEAAQEEALRLKENEERRAREFHAQPVPAHLHRPAPLPKAVDPVFTMPEPFHLESENRHREAHVLQEMRNQQELERQQRHAQFKAQPVPKLKEFKVAKSDRLLTVPDKFELEGDKRSRKRSVFDAFMAEKARLRQEEEALAEAERKRQEEEEVKAHRRTLQFKANPVPHYSSRGAAVQLPPPQWTEPLSPKLATEARASTRRRLA